MSFPKVLIREIRDILLLALGGILMTLAGLSCRDCYDDARGFWIIASFTSLTWILLWKGNSYLASVISTKVSWIEQPQKRFWIGLSATIAYTFTVMYLLGLTYGLSFDVNYSNGIWYSVIITLVISLFLHGREFLINWKKVALDAERHKRESIAAQYETLKSQVNPHFLFNSFNVLSNLVYEDQDKAVKFIKQLSEVYRYVLDTRDKEVVQLKDEMEFLNAYLYLQKIRFAEKLKVSIDLEETDNVFVPPLALQMLIENAIKHNIVSEEDPLTIDAYREHQYIVVRNNLQPKTSLGEPSAGVGLNNISRRYEFLTNERVQIEQDAKYFIVKLPVISE